MDGWGPKFPEGSKHRPFTYVNKQTNGEILFLGFFFPFFFWENKMLTKCEVMLIRQLDLTRVVRSHVTFRLRSNAKINK